ncbi:hypothetical protein [Herbidospora daliensis]|uniref:hypothetical protein n=1 Tax=Herbidospora daliensis TaxID=295585 RepID=UPI000780DFD1|nr:hypothetical protein [Herbidospora daliensis]
MESNRGRFLIKKTGLLVGGVIGAAALLPVFGASALSATEDYAHAYTSGTRVVLQNNSWQTNPGHTYANYTRSGSGSSVFNLNNPNWGTSVQSGTGTTVTSLRACVSIPVLPDDCSAWDE